MDTGAEVTAINRATYQLLGRPELKSPSKTLYGPAPHQTLKVLGQFSGWLKYDQRSIRQTQKTQTSRRNRKCPTLPQLWQTTPVAGHISPGRCLSRRPHHSAYTAPLALVWTSGFEVCPTLSVHSNLGFDGGVGLLPAEWWSLPTVASLMFV